MIAEQILNILESKIFIEFPEATDEEIEIELKKSNLKNGTIIGGTALASETASAGSQCCGATSCTEGPIPGDLVPGPPG